MWLKLHRIGENYTVKIMYCDHDETVEHALLNCIAIKRKERIVTKSKRSGRLQNVKIKGLSTSIQEMISTF